MGRLYKPMTKAKRARANNRGYFIASEVLNVSVPDYDYDNINRETARFFREAPLLAPRPDPAVVPTVRASYDEIQRSLDG